MAKSQKKPEAEADNAAVDGYHPAAPVGPKVYKSSVRYINRAQVAKADAEAKAKAKAKDKAAKAKDAD